MDKNQQTWIFDSSKCQVVVFDSNLSVLQRYKGICFDPCGFNSTTVLTINQDLDRVFWFKGDGVLSEFNVQTLEEKVSPKTLTLRSTKRRLRRVQISGR